MKDKSYIFDADILDVVIGTLKKYFNPKSICINIPVEQLCTRYKKLFPPKNNQYILNASRLSQLEESFISEELVHLQREGMVETFWIEEANDFGFSITPKGREFIKNLKKDQK